MADGVSSVDGPLGQLGTDIVLPYVTLQPDFAQSYTDVAQGLHSVESSWLSAYAQNAPRSSIHTKVLLASDAKRYSAQGSDDGVSISLDQATAKSLCIEKVTERSDFCIYTRKVEQQAGPSRANQLRSSIVLPRTIVRLPRRTLGPLVKGALGITAFDTSPTVNGYYVAGGADGQAHIGRLYEASTADTNNVDLSGVDSRDDKGTSHIERLAQERMMQHERRFQAEKRTHLRGHVGDIRSAKFFPSGEVVFTTSSDFTARVFGVDGSNPRVLKGHRRAVLSSAFVDRGKQVLTGSADGTTRLWDVGQGVQLASLMSHRFSSVNAISLGSRLLGDKAQSEKLLVTGLSSGVIEVQDMSVRQVVFRTSPIPFPQGPGPGASDSWEQVTSGAIEAVDWNPDRNLLMAGCNNGVVLAFDARMLPMTSTQQDSTAEPNADSSRALLASWRRNGSAINDLAILPGHEDILVATSDGTPYRATLRGQVAEESNERSHRVSNVVPQVVDEYAGWDVDNISSCGLDARGRTWLAGAGGMVRLYQ